MAVEPRKILVADDSPLFRDLEALFLARSGEVLLASDGVTALEVARRERPAVVVLDLHMPGLSGDALCSAIKTDPEIGETPVIIVTGGDIAGDHERAVRSGADDVIAKPLNRVTLIQAVNRLLRARRPGLTRVPLETGVHLRHQRSDAWGTARNLSRGGMFVQLSEPLPAATEVELEFALPDSQCEISPTAVVVWRRDGFRGLAPGVGLQFLRLDRSSAERIDEFVYQNAGPETGEPRGSRA